MGVRVPPFAPSDLRALALSAFTQSAQFCAALIHHEFFTIRSAEWNQAVGRAPNVIFLLMPFTFSHAAAALPFRRTRLMMSALIVGCFAPDFEYFLGVHSGFGHTLLGALAFDLPLAFAALWLFHQYAKEPLVACLPEGTRERIESAPRSLSIDSVSRFAMVIVSIIVGIGTHILWDSFTHPWYYPHWCFLRKTVQIPLFGSRPWYGVFEYASSVVGLLVILVWWLSWYMNNPPIHPRTNRRLLAKDRFALACAFVIALIAALVRAAGSGIPHGVSGSQRFMTTAAVTGVAVFWGEVVVYGLFRR